VKKRAKIQIKHNNRGVQKWWYVLVGANGEIIVTSEKFSSRADCRRRALRFIVVVNSIINEDIEEV